MARFGHYVTDGKTNAALKSYDSAEDLSLYRALELLAERRSSEEAEHQSVGLYLYMCT